MARSRATPPPAHTLSRVDARRFLLAHQHLWPPRSLQGKAGVMEFFGRVGSIQFDPINRVGRNPDLVLQSRVADFGTAMLEELLYEDRRLSDGWDKMAAIYPVSDWPFFARNRAAFGQQYRDRSRAAADAAAAVLRAIRAQGPASSADVEHRDPVDWFWGQPTSLAKAALEILHAAGDVVIHHRVGTRRFFDLAERCLPPEIWSASDPHPTREAYQEWHVLRRMGSLGLVESRPSEYWSGILDVKTDTRREILARLSERGDIIPVAVEGAADHTFFLRAADSSTLAAVLEQESPTPSAAIIAPLDNLLWDRELVRTIFGLDYVWEVYKPAAQRRFGYYVLPVLLGDRFVARFDSILDRLAGELLIANWLWEPDIEPPAAMEAPLIECLQAFLSYLDAGRVKLGDRPGSDPTLHWTQDLRPAR